MGWQVAAAEAPATSSDQSVTVALIVTLGTVLVALFGLAAQWVNRARTSESPPAADPRLGERVAVAETHVDESRRSLNQLDRHVDGIGDHVDRLQWEMDDMKAWREQHSRGHGLP